jgi:hypothetical protein
LWARGLHPADALACTHRENQEQWSSWRFSSKPVGESLTPSQARGLLTRVWIRTPFSTAR